MRDIRLRGFTLIELLVVIAIIAILAAILFPVFARTRKRAREAQCMVHAKQIAYAVQLYVDDWHTCYPDHASVEFPPAYANSSYSSYTGSYSNEMGTAWIQYFSHRYRLRGSDGRYVPAGIARVLRPYLKSIGIFKCPGEPLTRPDDAPNGFLPYDVGSSYYVKHALCFYANYHKHPLKQSEVVYPSRASLMYEEGWHGGERPYLWDIGYWGNVSPKPKLKVTAIFIDCHAGKIRIPCHPISGHDGNWYYYEGPGKEWSGNHYWDLSKGARDVP